MTMNLRTLALASIVVLAGCGGSGSSSGNGVLDVLPGTAAKSQPTALSPAGVYTVGTTTDLGIASGALWNGLAAPTAVTGSSGGPVTLTAVTDSGVLFGTENGVPESQVAVGTGWTPLPKPDGVTTATLLDASESGSIVLCDSGSGLYLVTSGVATPLSNSNPSGYVGGELSGDGTVIFQQSDIGITRRVGNDTPTVIIGPSGKPVLAGSGLTGSVIAGTITQVGSTVTHAFRWTSSGNTFKDLGTVGDDTSSRATAISRDGNRIVGVSMTDTTSRPFIWTSSNGMKKLTDYSSNDLAGLEDVVPTAISADSTTIAGYGTANKGTSSEQIRAWKIRIG